MFGVQLFAKLSYFIIHVYRGYMYTEDTCRHVLHNYAVSKTKSVPSFLICISVSVLFAVQNNCTDN